MNKQDILQKIENINKHLQREKGYYLNGGCLEYAKFLQKNIGGIIVYDRVSCHFLLYFGHSFFDVRGNVTRLFADSENIIWDPFLHYKESFFRGVVSENTIIAA